MTKEIPFYQLHFEISGFLVSEFEFWYHSKTKDKDGYYNYEGSWHWTRSWMNEDNSRKLKWTKNVDW